MNKKKRIAILFAVILVVAVGIKIAVTSHQKKEMDFDEFADRFEKSAEEVLGEDVRKVSKTELAATLTYGCRTDFADIQNKKECGGNRQWQNHYLRNWAANTKGKGII